MSRNPQDAMTSENIFVGGGYGGQAEEVFSVASDAPALTGNVFDMSRHRSFALSQSQSATGGWSGYFVVEQNLNGEWIALGTAVAVGTTTTYFETAERGYGKIRINPGVSLMVATATTVLTITLTGFRAGSQY